MDPPIALGEPLAPTIEYRNGKTMMASGALALHDHVATRMETALGKALPQVEVRFENVSITADIVVKDKSETTTGLPTLSNELMAGLRSLAAKKHTVKKHILKNVSGVLKPGTITLVLGQPGPGKSSLLKLLSGRFPNGKNVTLDGAVTYNGYPFSEFRKNLPQFTSYVSQRDKHYPALSVKETLEFAHACNGGGLSKSEESHVTNGTDAENKAALEAARAMYQHHPEIVSTNWALTFVRTRYVIMMDEISTGLDSASTFDIIATQRSLAKKFRKTVVISLLQPSPEVYSLFDSVVLLNEGQVMYNGPRTEALNYFHGLGFECPSHRDEADFLLDLGTKKQTQYEINPLSRSTRSISEFCCSFPAIWYF
ncbi:unnamed protein product [Phytophthora lilii]|uniref:Unnamed protein product n=1 Tax=Phytophthora lilii TaxID=2077276 RepID=A0A9W6X040_9STRA|nr:unnamed protein product [Phytophthora lilii]